MKYRRSTMISAITLLTFMTGILFTFTPQASALEASTTLTVVNVIDWAGATPDCTGFRKHDDMIHSVAFHPEAVTWTWEPMWPARRDTVSGSIWFFTSVNEFGVISKEGRYWQALSWDWIGNTTTAKHAEMWRGSEWMGLMFTNVCGANNVCDVMKTKERSNIMFAPNPYAY